MTATLPTDTWATIDSILGDAQGRFFGKGYQRIAQQVTDLELDEREAHGTGRILYPDNWSTKNGTKQQAHLSTLDGLSISAKLAVDLLNVIVPSASIDCMAVTRVKLRAGREPFTALTDFPIYISAEPATADGTRRFECQVANMWCHFDTIDTAGVDAGASSLRSFASPYQQREHAIREVSVSVDTGVARAVTITTQDGTATQPSLLDTVIIVAQLAQAQMYALDSLTRGSTHTLWMRSLELDRVPNPTVMDGPVPAQARILKAGLLPMAGSQWRTTRMDGCHGDYTLNYDLAHRIA